MEKIEKILGKNVLKDRTLQDKIKRIKEDSDFYYERVQTYIKEGNGGGASNNLSMAGVRLTKEEIEKRIKECLAKKNYKSIYAYSQLSSGYYNLVKLDEKLLKKLSNVNYNVKNADAHLMVWDAKALLDYKGLGKEAMRLLKKHHQDSSYKHFVLSGTLTKDILKKIIDDYHADKYQVHKLEFLQKLYETKMIKLPKSKLREYGSLAIKRRQYPLAIKYFLELKDKEKLLWLMHKLTVYY